MNRTLELDAQAVDKLEKQAIEDIDASKFASVALRRLVEDIQQQTPPPDVNAYNRMHNRHNRSR